MGLQKRAKKKRLGKENIYSCRLVNIIGEGVTESNQDDCEVSRDGHSLVD